MPAEQLGHQGEAGPLKSLGPAGNWLEARNGLCSCPSSSSSGFTFTEPAFKLVMLKCFLTETGDKFHPSYFQTSHIGKFQNLFKCYISVLVDYL